MQSTSSRFLLRDFSFPTRLVLAAFLASVGFGYFAALVQLHFQHASSGQLLPGKEETVGAYHGMEGMSQLERVLTADESKPFNGGGSMRPAFTTRSVGWKQAMRDFKKDKDKIQHLRDERDGERLVLLAWLKDGAKKPFYENDSYPLPENLKERPITEEYLVDKKAAVKEVKLQSIINDRCVRCHRAGTGALGQLPLETYEDIQVYCDRELSSGLSLTRLAQTTHVHLLGFSMLFGLTGLIFSFTSFPGWVRGFFGPFTLVAQLADIACWWLSRSDALFAQVLIFTGGLVAIGLAIQITGSLMDLFGRLGKVIIFVLIVAVFSGGYALKTGVIDPYLLREKLFPQIRDLDQKSQAMDPAAGSGI
jgi:hypothetical protein